MNYLCEKRAIKDKSIYEGGLIIVPQKRAKRNAVILIVSTLILMISGIAVADEGAETRFIQQTISVGQQQAIIAVTQAAASKEAPVTEVTLAASSALQSALLTKKTNMRLSPKPMAEGGNPLSSVYLQSQQAITALRLSTPKSNLFANYHVNIYDAHSHLFDDHDDNGFYQTFSVTFDADIIGPTGYEIATVYAELYLSRHGGPWTHYYTTAQFTIEGQSSDDDFEVLTSLASGYPADHYDLLIDLYEVGSSDIVATLSGDEVGTLYALPLESSDWDDAEPDVIIIEEIYSGGSLSIFAVLALFVSGVYRKVTINRSLS